MSTTPWWAPENEFFGEFYMTGDDSIEGYRTERQSLEERTQREVEGVVHLLSLHSKARILDLPCGYGRHSIELARRGHEVTGADINPVHLNAAHRRALEVGVDVDWQLINMLLLDHREKYDAVINMFYSFGFFDTDEENEHVAKNICRSLQKGGHFLMHTDVNVPRIINGQYKTDEVRTLKSGQKLHIVDSYEPDTGRINGFWEILSNGVSTKRKDYSVRVYTREEFEEICLSNGFSKVETYSDWNGGLYSPESEDMIIIATK